jgi:uncharacterized membrane-anchored protein YhcB (DUF1043 family)
MVESFDFSIGIIVGIAITFMANYITEKLKEREQRKTLARALITELEVIKDSFSKYKSQEIKEMPIFSTNITILVLLKRQTIDAVLRIYQKINYSLVSVFPPDIPQLVQQIDATIKIINEEL